MNLAGKLALTVVMLAIGAAPALSLAADPFRPGGEGGPPTRGQAPAASSPEAEPVQHRDDPPAEVAVPVVAIPQSEAEWAAWMALRNGEDEPIADAADEAETVETAVGEPEHAGWVYDEPEPEDAGSLYGEPAVGSEGSEVGPDGEAVDDAPDETEGERDGGLLGILG